MEEVVGAERHIVGKMGEMQSAIAKMISAVSMWVLV